MAVEFLASFMVTGAVSTSDIGPISKAGGRCWSPVLFIPPPSSGAAVDVDLSLSLQTEDTASINCSEEVSDIASVGEPSGDLDRVGEVQRESPPVKNTFEGLREENALPFTLEPDGRNCVRELKLDACCDDRPKEGFVRVGSGDIDRPKVTDKDR